MDYLQAIATLYRDGSLPRGVAMSPDLLQKILQDRTSLLKDGFRLWIEPRSKLVETTERRDGGKRLVKYTGSMIYAFEKRGQYYPDPSVSTPLDASMAVDSGDWSFLLDPTDMIIGWANTLSGSSYGELASSTKAGKAIWILMGVIVVVAILVRLLRS